MTTIPELGLSMQDTYKTIREYLTNEQHITQLFKIQNAIIGFWGYNNDPILTLIEYDVKRLSCIFVMGINNNEQKTFIEEMRIAKQNGEIIEMPVEFDINLFLEKLYEYFYEKIQAEKLL
jgi:hypothetical protein